jgi:hypothetical protein
MSRQKPVEGPTALLIDGGLEARRIAIGISKTMRGAPTETWVVHHPGEPGASVLQAEIFKPHGGLWQAWTGNYTRARDRELAQRVAAARNGTGTAKPHISERKMSMNRLYPKFERNRHFVAPSARPRGRVVADFNTLEDLVAHAGRELGATHVSGHDAGTKLYFPRGGHYPYEEASVWRKNGYWHAQGPGARTGVGGLPRDARPIGGAGRRAAEARRSESQRRWGPCPYCGATGWMGSVWPGGLNPLFHHDRPQGGRCIQALNAERTGRRTTGVAQRFVPHKPGRRVEDYIAVDNRGRKLGGPFKHYSEAKDVGGPGAHVQFVPKKSPRPSEAERKTKTSKKKRVSKKKRK